MEPSEILFNIHDLVLVLSCFLCVLFIVVECLLKTHSRQKKALLIFLMMALAMAPLHTLVMFGEHIRPWTLRNNVNLFFVFSFGYWFLPPLLFLYTRIYLLKDARLELQHLWHGLLPLAYLVFMYFSYYQYDLAHKQHLVGSWEIFVSDEMKAVFFINHVMTLVYLGFSWLNFSRYKGSLLDNLSSTIETDIKWLQSLVVVFTIRTFVISISYFVGVSFRDSQVGDTFGIASVYIQFVILIAIFGARYKYLPELQGVQLFGNFEREMVVLGEDKADSGEPVIQNEYPKYIMAYMKKHKPYLKQGINLKQLSEMLDMSPRVLSSTINTYFSANFFEFINSYRIAEAKVLLENTSESKRKITEICMDVGFNNRSVFNKVFKDATGVTPSEYRKKVLHSSMRDEIIDLKSV